MDTELLKELGLETAAKKIDKGQELKRKLAIAYEHYRFVSPDIFDRFQEELKVKTKVIQIPCHLCKGEAKKPIFKEVKILVGTKSEPTGKYEPCFYCQGTGAQEMTYDTLAFVPIEKYGEVPPPDCLMDLKKAKDMQCFDRFEVAKVETVEVRPDPIIFGLIDNCVDKFFVTQWNDDVKVEDILRKEEG